MTHRNRRTPARAAAFLGLVVASAALTSCGITGGLRANPGYARFGSLGEHGVDRDFALSLGPLPLRIAKAFVNDDPELASMLKGVKAVRFYSYTVHGEDADGRAAGQLDVIRQRLVRDGWDQVVAVRDDGERVAVLARMREKSPAIRGVAVVAYDESELILVNVIGNVRPENVTALLTGLDVELPGIAIGADAPASAALNEP